MASSITQVLSPANCTITLVKWKVKKDSMVIKGSVLALYELREKDASKNLMKLKASQSGIVDEIFVGEGSVSPSGSVLLSLRPQSFGGCTHPTVMKDMCADCGADLRREPGVAGERKTAISASVAMVHNIPELIISKEQALELGREDEHRLLKARKLVLLVDLDQTLIHTTNDDIPPNLKDVYHFQLWQGPQAVWYHTRLRPYAQKFLEKISKLYELHICTFGVRLYAHTVARIIDPDEKFFSYRILSRDECFDPLSKTANLKALFPCGDSMVCIIDDREDVWNFAPNLVHVKPYRFFQGTADINAPPGLTKSENDDIPIQHKVIDHHKAPTETVPATADMGCSSYDTTRSGTTDVILATDMAGNGEEDAFKKVVEADGDGSATDGCVETVSSDRRQGKGADFAQDTCAGATPVSADACAGATPVSSEACTGSTSDNDGDKKRMEMKDDERELKTEGAFQKDPEVEQMPATTVVEADLLEKEVADDLSVSSDSDGDSQVVEEFAVNGQEQGDNAQTPGCCDGSANVGGEGDSKIIIQQDEQEKRDSLKDSMVTENINNNHLRGSEMLQDPTPADSHECDGKTMASTGECEHKMKDDLPGGREMSSLDAGKEMSLPDIGSGQGNDKTVEWDDGDDYLLHLEDILTRIHKAFYTMYDESLKKGSVRSPTQTLDCKDTDANSVSDDPCNLVAVDNSATVVESPVVTPSITCPAETTDFKFTSASASSLSSSQPLPDLKSIIPYVKRKTLRGCNIVFSGLVPLNTPLEKSQAYIVAKGLGANVQPDIVDAKQAGSKELATTHLVAAKPGTSKHKMALHARRMHIVSSAWLWACAERWEKCDPRLFPLGKDSVSTSSTLASEKEASLESKQKSLKRTFDDDDDDDDNDVNKGSKTDQTKRRKTEGDALSSNTKVGTTRPADEEAEVQMLSDPGGSSFASTVHPLLSFSDEDLECMDKEVDDLLAEEASGSSEESEERNERLRKTVLRGAEESDSSSDSLSGDFPRGWRLKRKVSSPHSVDDDLGKRQLKEAEMETEDTENEFDNFQKTIDTFAPDTDSSSSSNGESIGSVDDEIADAVEKEFLASL